MAYEETTQFLNDLFLRYDPDADLTVGSRLRSEVIQPILDRVGIDPFDQDIATFVRERVRQSFPDLALTEVDALTDTVIDPMRILIEPLVREVKLIKLRASLRNIESISDEEVDSLMANFFEPRRSGGFALGVVRAYFTQPVTVSATLVNPAFGPGGLRYFPTVPQQITADQMLLNQSGSEFYFDINYTAERRGDEYNLEAGTVRSIANFPSASRVQNLRRFRDGAPRETSVEYVARVSSKLSDRTLTVIRGILSELFDNFPTLEKIQVIGTGDPEMLRDVVTGGGMGIISEDGTAFGADGTFPDDGDGDASTQLFDSPTGAFVARIGSVGDDPGEVYLSVFYNHPVTGVFSAVDTKVTAIVSDTRIRLADEIPVGAVPTGLLSSPWALRRREITLSGIPGGITLPDRADGSVVISDDTIHIGGKTDVYVAGGLEAETAQIDSLTDEEPLARGVNAYTTADVANPDIIYLPEYAAPLTDLPLLQIGMSFVLEEGADIGSYLIQEVIRTGAELRVRLSVAMTGTQTNLAWKIVDDIDVELTEPKDIKVTGNDLVTVTDNPTVTTTGGTNFADANVQVGDILRLVDDLAGGDFEVAVVGPTSLELIPAPTRSIIGGQYSIFRLGEAVLTPVVRIRSMELLDSSGAPVGTVIPYRDPVLAESEAFQNQGNEAVYEGPARVGLVTVPSPIAGFNVSGLALVFRFYDPARPYAGEIGNHTFTFAAVDPLSVTTIVSELNADPALQVFAVRATELEYAGREYVGIFSTNLIRIDHGAATAILYATNGSSGSEVSNAMLNTLEAGFEDEGVRVSDLVAFTTGENTGVARLLHTPYLSSAAGTAFPHEGHVTLGNGPAGPRQTAGTGTTDRLGKLYFNKTLIPEIGTQIRIGRPSIGSVRCYYLDPTSAEFDFRDTRFTTEIDAQHLEFLPDPENLRTIQPAPPLTVLPDGGTLSAPTLVDPNTNYLALGIRAGDVLEVLYNRVLGAGPLAAPPATVAVAGLSLIVSIADGPFVTLIFPIDYNRDDLVDYINEQLGGTYAYLDAGALYFEADVPFEVSAASTSLAALLLINRISNIHPSAGEYIIAGVEANTLTLSTSTPAPAVTYPDTQYRVRRYVQRISSTEMNDNTDETGLYYADVELISSIPGNRYNIPAEIAMEFSGQRGDGYRLATDSSVLSYSRAEVLTAEISKSILLVGSSDSPSEYLQLSRQNLQVNYDRSQIADDVQSFMDSDFNRVTTQESLARHLLPHFVSLSWQYSGGDAEVTMRRALVDKIGEIDADEELEVGRLVDALRRQGALSVFSPSTTARSGRTAPLFVVVYHALDRAVRAQIVRDVISTGRVQRFIPDNISVTRLAPRGPLAR